jgi:DNA-binding response OmpR family regulator
MLSILVVDDDPMICKTMCDVIRLKGYLCDSVYDGIQAISRLREKTYQCVFMDIKMPGKNGVEVFKEIREIAPKTLVVLITAFTSDNLVQEAKKLRVSVTLPKPLNLKEINKFLRFLEKGKNILIVDDDEDFCKTLADILSLEGYQITTALSAKEALEKFDKMDIVILDIKLNHINGLDVLREIRAKTKDIQVVLVTGYYKEMESAIDEALKIKAHTCFPKPIDIKQLSGVLEEVYTNKISKFFRVTL